MRNNKLDGRSSPRGIQGNTALVPHVAATQLAVVKRLELAPDQYVAPPPPPAARPILLYNDQCEVCRLLSSWVKRQDAEGQDLIDERPIGNDPDALLRIDPRLDIWKVYEKIHLLMPSGEIKVGGAAIAEVLKSLHSTHLIGALADLQIAGRRPFLAVLEGAYRLLDRIRPAIGCASCGGGNVPWWAMPIKWAADSVRAIKNRGAAHGPT